MRPPHRLLIRVRDGDRPNAEVRVAPLDNPSQQTVGLAAAPQPFPSARGAPRPSSRRPLGP
jgi:hypothetical protein